MNIPYFTSVHFIANIQMCELTSASSPQPLHKYLAPSPGWMLCRNCGGGRDDGENGGGRDGWRKERWREEGWQERRVGEEWREEEEWWDYGMEGRGGKGMEGGGMRDEGGGMEGRGKSGETMVRERIKWWMYPSTIPAVHKHTVHVILCLISLGQLMQEVQLPQGILLTLG